MRTAGERHRLWVCWLLFLWLSKFWASPATSQPGFLSIDCGSDRDYEDTTTGISWVSDEGYIYTGSTAGNITVRSSYNIANKNQVGTLRYFEERSKNCYVLPTKSEQTYLLRAVFFYGDWRRGSEANSRFQMYLNSTLWLDFSYISGQYLDITDLGEAVFYSPGTVINFCLVRIVGASFISTLELRELESSMYAVVGPAKTVFLSNVRRVDCTTDSDSFLRYPDDPYDRLWTLLSLNATIASDPGAISNLETAYPDQPPLLVLQDAWIYYNSKILWYYYDLGMPYGDVYTTAYFLEVDGNASATKVRGMTYTLNDEFITSFNVSNVALEITSPVQNIGDRFVNMSFIQTNWSELKPNLNAFEIYQVFKLNESKIADQDLTAISALKSRWNLTDWTGDPCLPVPYDWIGCSQDKADSIFRVNKLALANMRLEGEIAREISNLTALTNLYLNNNSLNGSIPNFNTLVHLKVLHLENNFLSGNIPSFTSLQNLTELYVDNNNLTGEVPANLLKKPGLTFSRSNNTGLVCKDKACPSSKHNQSSSTGVLVGSILGSLAAMAIIGGIIWYVCTRKKRARSSIVKAIGQANEGNPSGGKSNISKHALSGSITMMTLQEVSDATRKFSTKIGEGSFGPVYHGRLVNGQEVAIKVKSRESRQGFREFINEVEMLSRIHHRNLVSLVGFCEEAEQQILIYVYLRNGSLRDHLYGEISTNSLSWETRLDIAIDAAKGLQYLHTDCTPRIIHRDVKSANILLDENMAAKVADFGISKETPEGVFTGLDTVLKGTPGYLDPEYYLTQRLSPKSDVYSFGIVLLEIVSGRHPHLSVLPDGTQDTLLQWARNSVREKVEQLFDPSMEGNFKSESIMKVVSLALRCTDPSTANRPIMAKVVSELSEVRELEHDPHPILQPPHYTDADFEDKYGVEDDRPTVGSYVANDTTIVTPR